MNAAHIVSTKRLVALFLSCAITAIGQVNQPKSYVAADAMSTMVFYESNSSQSFAPGGFCKIATAVVTLDWAEKTGTDMSVRARVGRNAVAPGIRNPMGLRVGDQIQLRDALYSSLLGNDDTSAVVLATHVGSDIARVRRKSVDPEKEFVMEMNNLAALIGMKRTIFESPEGSLMYPKRDGRSTARDLALLASHAMVKPSFRFYTVQGSRAISVDGAAGRRSFRVRNGNSNVGSEGIDGVTGLVQTGLGPSTITSAKKAPVVQKLANGSSAIYTKRLVVVTIGSSDPMRISPNMLRASWVSWEQWHANGRNATADQVIRPPRR